MGIVASQITGLTIVYTTVYSDADQSKHQSCASLAFMWGIHRGPVNSPHKWPVTRKMFPFDDVIMICNLTKTHLGSLPSEVKHPPGHRQAWHWIHYNDVTMSAMASQITDVSNCWFQRRSKKVSKLCVSGLCAGNSPVTGEFPTQKASDAENASIWWRHHVRRVNGCLFSAMKGFNHLLVFENYVKCKSMLLFYSLNKLSFTRDPMSC